MNPSDSVNISLDSAASFTVPVWVSCISFTLLAVAFVLAVIWFNRVRNARALILALGCFLYATARLPEFLSVIPSAQHSYIAFQIARFTSRFAPWADLVATLLLTGYILFRLRQSYQPRIDD